MTAPVFTMPFGKHAGKPLSELPSGYLRWLAEPDRLATLYPNTRAAVAAEVERRQATTKPVAPEVPGWLDEEPTEEVPF
jgi:hypothetical protein